MSRYVKEGRIVIGPDEEGPFTIDVTPWGNAPTNVAITTWDQYTDQETNTFFVSGTATVNSNTITTPKFSQTKPAGREYLIRVSFDLSGNRRSCLIPVFVEER